MNECSSNPCQNSGTCNDEVNGYTCVCVPGYAGTECGTGMSTYLDICTCTYMDLCNLQLHNRFYEITKASLALGVRDYTGTIWPNNLYYSTIFSQSRLNGNQFKPEPAAGIFHSCSSLCIAKLCLENLSLEILWFYQQSLRFSNTFCLRVTTSSCVD